VTRGTILLSTISRTHPSSFPLTISSVKLNLLNWGIISFENTSKDKNVVIVVEACVYAESTRILGTLKKMMTEQRSQRVSSGFLMARIIHDRALLFCMLSQDA
jgi:hypothetical protein